MKWLSFLALGCLLSLQAVAEDKPEEMLAAAKKLMVPKVLKVAALVTGEKNFKIAGLIAGEDFDLTVEDAKGKTRQIVVGPKAWSSTDAGKTWKPMKTVDRRFYFLTHAAINYRAEEKIPPFEKLGVAEEGGETLMHIRFIAKQEVGFEGDRPNAWLIMKDGAPMGVRRYIGPLVFEKDYLTTAVRYAEPKDAAGVLPPPGNPEALPVENSADALLAAAQGIMATGVWEVDGTIAGPKTIQVHGLLSGRDFDLTFTGDDGPATRQIVIKDKAWLSSDGGKTWKTGAADDRLIYNLVHTPLLADKGHPEFEDAGREENDGETLQHVRLKVAEKLESENQRPHYWIGLMATGKPTCIRRYHGAVSIQGGLLDCKINYGQAEVKAISRPPGKK